MNHHHKFYFLYVTVFVLCASLFAIQKSAEAASLQLSPNTGVYTVGGVFTANIIINTQGKAVNAADAQLAFNPRELSVVSASRGGSIFNLWTQEPSFSNSAGTISFGGGSPTGYTGSSGIVASITFRIITAGTTKVNFTSGSILAADGLGTNVLTTMSGGSYTSQAVTANPEPEYIAPANTPKAPVVTSPSHPDQTKWYREKTAELSWTLPSDVIAVRTLLDTAPATIPTIVYDEPISKRSIEGLPEGVSYFHIQFKNKEGWGKVTHFRLGVDSESPSAFEISEAPNQDAMNPAHSLVFTIEDISPITTYRIQIDGGDPIDFIDSKETKQYQLPALQPGHHSVIVEAFDSAGNSRVATYTFDIQSFEKPTFTDYPVKIQPDVIPAIKGTTRPQATVFVTIAKVGADSREYTITADESGVFIFIPDSTLSLGVYDISAFAKDSFEARSEVSDTIRLLVEESGYMRIGSRAVSILSIIVPLIALIALLLIGTWYLLHRFKKWRRLVTKETLEAEESLSNSFDAMVTNLHKKVTELKISRKGKLTKAETALIEQIEDDLKNARATIRKEITDIDEVIT